MERELQRIYFRQKKRMAISMKTERNTGRLPQVEKQHTSCFVFTSPTKLPFGLKREPQRSAKEHFPDVRILRFFWCRKL